MNYKQTYFTVILTILLANSLHGQNLFVSNVKNNLVFANPSFAVLNDFSVIQSNYRNQWPINGVYNTYAASLFHNVVDFNSNIGLVLNYDKQFYGVNNNYSFGLNYAYKLELSHRRNYLLFGLFGSYNVQEIDYSNLVFETPGQLYPENSKRNYPVFNVGVTYLANKTHAIGFSIVNPYSFIKNPFIVSHVNISYLGMIDLRRYNSLVSAMEPLANIMIDKNKIESRLGCNLEFYNFKSGVLLNFGNFNLNASSFLLGFFSEEYELIYSYELFLSKSVTISPKIAAHEVTFLWKYQYKKRRKRHRAIKCPDI